MPAGGRSARKPSPLPNGVVYNGVVTNGTHVEKQATIKPSPAENGEGAAVGSSRRIDARNYDHLLRVVDEIRSKVRLTEPPRLAMICGSGLKQLAEMVREAQVLPFAKITGFPTTHVIGHPGNFVFGYIHDTYVVCLQGRFHPYEKMMDLGLCAMPVRVMHLLGATTLFVTNAAGGVNPRFHHGDLMLIRDHISMPGLAGFGPLLGLDDPRFGERFVSMHNVYNQELRRLALEVAEEANIPIHEGVYTMLGGPQFETPAEVAFLKAAGSDALGMSTCHEATVALHTGMKVLGLSLISNMCITEVGGISAEVSHEEVLQTGKEAGQRACRLFSALVKRMEEEGLL